MPTSVFQLQESGARAATLDAKYPNTNLGGNFVVGLIYLGPTKAHLRRAIATFDVFSNPLSGAPLHPGMTITAAQVDGTVVNVTGLTSQASTIARITRADWVTAEATWNNYKSGNAWTTAGGDVDNTTPTPLGFNSPATNGAYTITGLVDFVTDAVNNRNGVVNIRAKFNDESDNGLARFWAFYPLSDVRLTVTYTATPQSLAGTLGNLTGVLTTVKRRVLSLAGSLGPLTGTLATRGMFVRALAGSLGALSGALTTVATFRIALAGTLSGWAATIATVLTSIGGAVGRRLPFFPRQSKIPR